MNWAQITIAAGAILILAFLVDIAVRAAFWPRNACRLLDATSGRGGLATWQIYLSRIRLWAAAIALFAVLTQGFDSLLYWVPGSWGSVDEYGEWSSTRRTAAGMLAVFFTCLAFGAFCARVEPEREGARP